MVPKMALPSGSTDNVASHIQVRCTGVTVAQVVRLIVVSLRLHHNIFSIAAFSIN
jgi:hypothetical protein